MFFFFFLLHPWLGYKYHDNHNCQTALLVLSSPKKKRSSGIIVNFITFSQVLLPSQLSKLVFFWVSSLVSIVVSHRGNKWPAFLPHSWLIAIIMKTRAIIFPPPLTTTTISSIYQPYFLHFLQQQQHHKKPYKMIIYAPRRNTLFAKLPSFLTTPWSSTMWITIICVCRDLEEGTNEWRSESKKQMDLTRSHSIVVVWTCGKVCTQYYALWCS